MKRQNSISLLDFTNFLEAGAVLRSGNEWILTYGASPSATENSVFSPSFYDVEEAKPTYFQNEARLSQIDFLNLCQNYLETAPEAPLDWSLVVWKDPDLSDFTKTFSHTQQLISQGQIDKAVPCVFAQAEGRITLDGNHVVAGLNSSGNSESHANTHDAPSAHI